MVRQKSSNVKVPQSTAYFVENTRQVCAPQRGTGAPPGDVTAKACRERVVFGALSLDSRVASIGKPMEPAPPSARDLAVLFSASEADCDTTGYGTVLSEQVELLDF
jgi:hypothetical protein